MTPDQIYTNVFEEGNPFAGTKAYCDATPEVRKQVRELVAERVTHLLVNGSLFGGERDLAKGADRSEGICNQMRHLVSDAELADEEKGVVLPLGGEKVVLGFAQRAIFGDDSKPRIAQIQRHPKNGWLVDVVDSAKEVGELEQVQLTDNECNEMGGFTTRHVTPR